MNDLGWPRADWPFWAVEKSDRIFAPAQRRGGAGPEGDIPNDAEIKNYDEATFARNRGPLRETQRDGVSDKIFAGATVSGVFSL
jgi:hypothetical protein